MLTVNTNVLSLYAQNKERLSRSVLSVAIERLSSGLRINSAKDDAAGQSISNRFTAQINGQKAAARNANDGISMMQTAGGALSSINDRLQRMRELTVQGLNGTYNQADRDSIQAELNLNMKEIDRITEQTHFNGIRMLDGSVDMRHLQIGAYDGQTLNIEFDPKGFGVESLGLKDFYISGIIGDINDIHVLDGNAVNVMIVGDPNTTVNYYDLSGNSLSPAAKFMRQGAGSYFVQDIDANGEYIHYLSTGYDSLSTTVDRSSEVNIRADTNTMYEVTKVIDGNNINGSTNFFASNGITPLSGSPSLIQADGNYYIKRTESGETFYYQAELSTTRSTSGAAVTTVKVVDDSARLSTQEYTDLNNAPILGKPLNAASFTYEGGGAFNDGSSHELVEVGGKYYVRADDNGEFRYYSASIETNLSNNTVSVTAKTDALSTHVFANDSVHAAASITEYKDLGGNTLNDANLSLKQDENGVNYIFDSASNTYLRATINYFDNGGNPIDPDNPGGYVGDITAVIQADTNLAVSAAGFTDAAVTDNLGNSPSVDANTSLLAGQTLVTGDVDGKYYIYDINDGGSYTPVGITTKIGFDGAKSIDHTSPGLKRFGFSFTNSNAVNNLPSLSIDNATSVTNSSGFDLVANQNGTYFLRDLDNDKVTFYHVDVKTNINSDGTFDVELVQGSQYGATINDVEKVTGDSLVDLDTPIPSNVIVNYVNSSGQVLSNVLSKDADGNYVMHISSGGENKTATLVQVDNLEDHLISQDGDFLVKTVNGAGDVIIYQAMNYTATTDAGSDNTVVVITETGQEIRLRQPRDPLAALDRAIAKIDAQCSLLGAMENRAESIINVLTVGTNNLSAARSRIMDADYAVEVSNMTRSQIIQQASVSVLAQANQIPQNILSLLN